MSSRASEYGIALTVVPGSGEQQRFQALKAAILRRMRIPGNVFSEARFRLGSARKARELHAELGRLKQAERELEEARTELSSQTRTVERFHELYYEESRNTWQNTYWMGTRVMKCPTDLWIYQEIVNEVKPDLIVETGTALGGSALYFAHLCDALERGRVVTVDLQERPDHPVPKHRRIRYLTGSSVESKIVEEVREEASSAERVLVVLDSDHSRDHVHNELDAYASIVSPNSYLIVEDTNINGHPVYPDFGPGPMEAVEAFLRSTDEFEIDETREKFYMTFNPRGFLRRKYREPHRKGSRAEGL